MKLSLPFRRPILSLDIGAYEIKIVEGKQTNKGIKIDKYFTVRNPLKAYDNGKILDKNLIHYALSEGFTDKKIKANDVYLTINNPSIITREVVIPKVEDKEIKDILKFQIEDYIPIKPEEYIVQFNIIEEFYEDDVEKLSILLIAMPKEMVEEHFKLLKSLDLNPIVLDYQPNSIAKLIQYNNYINDKYYTGDTTFAVIDIGYDNTKVYIIRDGNIQVSRIIESGGKHIEQDTLNFPEYNQEKDEKYNSKISITKKFFKTLNQRIDLIFRYFLSRKISNKIDSILLIGGSTNIDGIEENFSNNFNIPAIKIKSFDKITLNDEIYKYINSIAGIIRKTEV